MKRSRLSQVTQRLVAQGQAALTAHGGARKRWSAMPRDPEALLDWRNVTGSRTRQLLRNIEHTGAVHAFAAAQARQARSRSREIVQLDPPRRASRYFRHQGGLRSVHPDAFGVLRRGEDAWPFFLEWERRAVRPATMAARIAPYLRYYPPPGPPTTTGCSPWSWWSSTTTSP